MIFCDLVWKGKKGTKTLLQDGKNFKKVKGEGKRPITKYINLSEGLLNSFLFISIKEEQLIMSYFWRDLFLRTLIAKADTYFEPTMG